MGPRSRPLAAISTQYARNGPLLEESREYVRLVARGLGRAERREFLVTENGLRRQTYKARRNIFEALEARFQDERRAAHLGLLTLSNAPAAAFSIGVLLETARHDALIGALLRFIVRHIGMSWDSIDARLFLSELERETGVVGRWAPSLQKRAVSSLNAVAKTFGLWPALDGTAIPPIDLPIELFAIIVQERLMDKAPSVSAPEFAMLGMDRRAVIDALWSCARRDWFTVDIVGDVVRVESRFSNVAAMLGVHHAMGICA